MKLLFLPGSTTAPAARFRLWQFVGPLRAMGHEVTVRALFPDRYWTGSSPIATVRRIQGYLAALLRLLSALWITRDIAHYDAVIMNRDLVPEPRVSWLEPWLARRNPCLIFDFDDAIFLGPRAEKLRKILPAFALVTAGNDYLAEFARLCHNNVRVWPTVVDTDRFMPASSRTPGVLRIGWSGSRSTMSYCLPLLQSILIRLSETIDFEFLVVSDRPPDFDWPGVRTRFIPWSAETEVESLQQMDIGLMPLRDESFERGKCGAKALTYMAVGIPALVSPVGVNARIVRDGVEGYHCRNDQDWIDALARLADDSLLRQHMGADGRERVMANYSVAALLPEMIDSFAHPGGAV